MNDDPNLQTIPPNVANNKNNIFFYGLGGLGCCILSLGIISLIASNWNKIGPQTKLFTYFILQTSLGIGYLKTAPTRILLKEILLHLFAIGFFSGIGLIAQIFQLSGANWEPLAFWLLLTFAAALVTEKSLLINLWWIVFFIMLWFLLLENINNINGIKVGLFFNIYMAIVLLIMAIGFNIYNPNFKIKLSNKFMKVGLKYSFSLLIIYTSIFGTMLCEFRQYYMNIISYDMNMIIPTFNSVESTYYKNLWLYFLSLLTICSIYFNASLLKQSARKSLITLIVVINLFNSLPIYFTFMQGKIWGTLWFTMLWLCVAWNCILLSYKNLYRLAIIVIMLKFIALYVVLFGSLLLTGIGLIISGLLFLLLTFLCYKYQKVLLNWIEHE